MKSFNMKLGFKTYFRVRGNETNEGGIISVGTLANYYERGRWEAFESDLFEGRKMFSEKAFVRAQTIECYLPIQYPADCHLNLWISRVGKTSIDFGSEICLKDGVCVSRARTTAVNVGQAGPEPFPQWVHEYEESRETPEPLVQNSQVPENIFVDQYRIRPSDIDSYSHMNQARYIDLMNDVRLYAFQASHEAGFCEPIQKISLVYQKEIKPHEVITIHLWKMDESNYGIQFKNQHDDVMAHGYIFK